jgi:hypothetical protein
MKRPKTVKIGTRITEEENRRIEYLAIVGGFRSTYSLLKYLIFCFLRASNRGDDGISREVPPEIIKLFIGNYEEDARMISRAIKNLHMREYWKVKKREERGKQRIEDTISEDIRDLFDECEQEGERLQWKPDINKRM